MAIGLGIDTGGTYTDAVVYDFDARKLIGVSKSVTTKEDLVGCIGAALDGLPGGLPGKIDAVSLSTTLATNACIEGKGGRARLVLIGSDEKAAASYGAEYGLPPVKEIIFLSGGHDQKGNVVREPDWDFLKRKIDGSADETDSYAVVEIWGMNNCDFENEAKRLISGWTGRKVVCGHELTARINLMKRAASALLNAQLIPLIGDFLKAIKKSLADRGINAPIAIVRGDGSLMNEEFAMERPVETLLCGPAASVEGGIILSGEKDCLIIDMGGTTSDMALVKNHLPRLAEEGAVVGKWRTGTHSIMIDTIGLGGDSRIAFGRDYSIELGFGRVAPLCWAAGRWPGVKARIREIHAAGKKYYYPLCEFLYLTGTIPGGSYYKPAEKALAKALADGPVDILRLSEDFGEPLVSYGMNRLEKHGVISRIGLTPTDIMHIRGEFTSWDAESAALGLACLAFQTDRTSAEIMDTVYEAIKERMFLNISKTLIEDEDRTLLKDGMSGQLRDVLLNGFRKARRTREGRPAEEHVFFSSLTTPFTLVGIGAPIHVFLRDVAAAMGTSCVIPENAHVANAIGAITGSIRTEKKVPVVPNYSSVGITGYSVFPGSGKADFKNYDE
ncbi:MAG: hydantoinase/oxoprolinase family protein, partial [Clostridia bacterium]|nr:hydantoinase/oxoprolinase family protein [Clostridia bacterium]